MKRQEYTNKNINKAQVSRHITPPIKAELYLRDRLTP